MTTIKHTKNNNITDWTQAQLDAIIAGGAAPLPPLGTVLNDVVLPSDWNHSHTVTGTLNTLAGYDGSGNSQDVTVGSGLSLSGGTLTASGGISIGGTVTSGTAGSVLFINPTATLAQDNGNFFWDETNKRLGIGTGSPSAKLHVDANSTGVLAANFLNGGVLIASNGFNTIIRDSSYGWVFAGTNLTPQADNFSDFGASGSRIKRIYGLNGSFSNVGGTVSNVVLTVQGAASQTADLQEWQNSSGTVGAAIPAKYTPTMASSTANDGNAIILNNSAGSGVISNVPYAGSIPSFNFVWDTAKPAAGLRMGNFSVLGTDDAFFQIAPNDGSTGYSYFESLTSLGLVLGTSNTSPVLINPNRTEQVRVGLTTQGVKITNPTSTLIGLVVKGASSQTANLQEWQNNSAVALASVNAAGSIIASSGFSSNITTVTTTYTILATDYTVLCDATSAGFTATLPTAVGCKGRIYNIKKIDSSAHNVTLKGNGSETIDGSNTNVISTQYGSITVQSDNTNWNII